MTAATAQQANVHTLLTSPPYPAFEGQVVEGSEIKISGLSALDGQQVEGKIISTDDRVRLVGEFKVVSVRHYLNKDGKLVREQTLKPERVDLCPWDPSDPDDDGILRARPRP